MLEWISFRGGQVQIQEHMISRHLDYDTIGQEDDFARNNLFGEMHT